ncbi:uncharacterized protein Z520_08454 [Fonsecaea multimorphosa CBS 102226]|uniref:Arrestin-like N-terminal domain-containing protein n=1 Tax=Fonsecaea multimorphosa CBS 102226 TaxID=1442371 RepID=A0A0D2IF62_9EURO|nr:uncharacterized protein Z520_08454 [Fonsecaea multimorphosa CBS 102226]KIX95746.1 hypothetical protein Z520_08454 [Fonsecaea multimorphosa CBS 102226]
MTLTISFSHDESKPLTPGSMVLGVVKFMNYEDQVIESLSLTFKGQTSVFLNQYYGDLVSPRTEYASKSYLFSRHLDLYSGECIQHKGNYAWPFALRIPLFAAPRSVPSWSKELFNPKHPWKGDLALQPHPLPPSMQQNGKFVCTIQYILEAKLVHRPPPTNNSESKGREVKSSRTVSVQNLEMPGHSAPGLNYPYVSHRHTVRCPLGESSHWPVRRLLPMLHKKQPPTEPEMNLCFSVLLPKKLELKEHQTLSIPTSCTMNSSTATEELASLTVDASPDLVIHSFKLSLFQQTHVRAGCHTGLSTKCILARKGSCRVPISRISKSVSETAIDTPTTFVNLCDIVDLSVPVEILASDFSTYNIARCHTLEVSFSLEYRGKKYKFTLRRVPIRVGPRSGGELERRLSEGLEMDDEYGCDLAGIQWREYGRTSGFDAGSPRQAIPLVIEGFDGDVPATPPPAYTA